MNIAQLIDRIDALFPFGGAESLTAAAADYGSTLRRYEGALLHKAWDATIGDWRKGFRPLPADIAANVPQPPKPGEHAAVKWGDVHGRQRALIDDWWMMNTTEAEAFIATFEHDDRDAIFGPLGPDNWRDHMNAGATDRICARGKLADEVARRCWREAIFQIRGRPPRAVEIEREDYDRIRGQVETQRQRYPKGPRQLFGYADVKGQGQDDWTKRARFVARPEPTTEEVSDA